MHKDLQDNLRRILFWTLTVVTTSFIFISLAAVAEKQVRPEFATDLGTVLWWWIVTISTVGYGDITAITPLGRLFAGLTIFTGWVFFALLISEFNQLLKLIYRYDQRGLKKINYKGHVVIIGYGPLTAGVIESIRKKYDKQANIVLIASGLETNPFADLQVDFVNGDPLDSDVITQANIPAASVVIVLADENRTHPDAYNLVVGTKVEKLKANIYTVVEITDQSMQGMFTNSKIDKLVEHKDFLQEIVESRSPVIENMYAVIDKTLADEAQHRAAQTQLRQQRSLSYNLRKIVVPRNQSIAQALQMQDENKLREEVKRLIAPSRVQAV